MDAANAVKELSQIDILSFLVTAILIMAAVVLVVGLIGKFSEIIKKPVFWVKDKNDDHKLLITTAQELKVLSEQHKKDVEESNEHDKMITDNLTQCVYELKNSIVENKNTIKEFTKNQEVMETQIKALMCGSKELLGEAIDTRYSKYVSLDGIPENEVSEFEDLHQAYKNLNGNHSRDTKYQYVKDHLQVIPVISKMIVDK